MLRTLLRPVTSLASASLPALSARAPLAATLLGAGAVAIGGAALMSDDPVLAGGRKVALDADNWKDFAVAEVKKLSHDSSRIRVLLDSPEHELGMDVASFVLLKADVGEGGKPVVHPYTPTTFIEKGYFDLVVKSYPTGSLSKHLGELTPGDKVTVKGPIMKLKYEPNMKKSMGFIAGGSGITPMYQVISAVLRNPEDKTDLVLIYQGIKEEDLLLREELDALARLHPQFKVFYTLKTPPAGWKAGKGYVSEEQIAEHIGAPSDDKMVFVCGAPAFYNSVSGGKAPDYSQGELKGHLKALGYSESQVFKF